MVYEGMGYAISYNKIVDVTGDSNLCFTPLYPQKFFKTSGDVFSKPANRDYILKGIEMKVEQFVMAYGVEQDRLRAILPEGFTSIRPVLRINGEIRDDKAGYIEFNTAVEKDGIKGWLNIGHWENMPFDRTDQTVTFKSEFLEISFTGVGIEGSCPAEKDNGGCFFIDENSKAEELRLPEAISVNKEFCDCKFKWSFTEYDAHGESIGETLPVLFALFLQALYGAIDLVVVGRFGGERAGEYVSAVATGSQVMQTLTIVITGLAMGLTVSVGREIGAGRPERAGEIIGSGIVLIQGLVGAFGVRIPLSWIISKQAGATLFHIGLATPASPIVQILLCFGYLFLMKRRTD